MFRQIEATILSESSVAKSSPSTWQRKYKSVFWANKFSQIFLFLNFDAQNTIKTNKITFDQDYPLQK